jgi:ATP-binding protein involved in chromosome partitioning
MIDPRVAAVESRLAGVESIVAVTGGKGGIGKSFVASALALVNAKEGKRVGLLDLDFTSPSTHVILGYETGFPTEEWGIDPAVHHGVHCMSIAHFAPDQPAPMRGEDVTNALLELLAITRWGELDLLVIDMPPGIGDAALDAMRLLGRAQYVVVAGSSKVVLNSVRRTVRLLREVGAPMIGVVENMQRRSGDTVKALAEEERLPYLGRVPYDDAVEDAIGDPDRLAATEAVKSLRAIMAQARAAAGREAIEEESA